MEFVGSTERESRKARTAVSSLLTTISASSVASTLASATLRPCSARWDAAAVYARAPEEIDGVRIGED